MSKSKFVTDFSRILVFEFILHFVEYKKINRFCIKQFLFCLFMITWYVDPLEISTFLIKLFFYKNAEENNAMLAMQLCNV